MSKTSLLYLIPVCLLSACGGGGGGDKEKINVTNASSALKASVLSGTTHEFTADDLTFLADYDDLISLSNSSVQLVFGDDVIKQTAKIDGWNETQGTWANVEFKTSDFTWEDDSSNIDYKILRATMAEKDFHMIGAELKKSFDGKVKGEIALGGQAVGLQYSDFGYIHVTVNGKFKTFSNTADEKATNIGFAYFETFKKAIEDRKVGDSSSFSEAIHAALGNDGAGNVLSFTGKAFASMSGDIFWSDLQNKDVVTSTSATGEETKENRNILTVSSIRSSMGATPVVGNAELSIDPNGRANLWLDFTDNGGGIWNFSKATNDDFKVVFPEKGVPDPDKDYLNGSVDGYETENANADLLEIKGTTKVSFDLFGESSAPTEGIGSFSYTQEVTRTPQGENAPDPKTTTHWFAGAFGVANPTVQTPTSAP